MNNLNQKNEAVMNFYHANDKNKTIWSPGVGDVDGLVKLGELMLDGSMNSDEMTNMVVGYIESSRKAQMLGELTLVQKDEFRHDLQVSLVNLLDEFVREPILFYSIIARNLLATMTNVFGETEIAKSLLECEWTISCKNFTKPDLKKILVNENYEELGIDQHNVYDVDSSAIKDSVLNRLKTLGVVNLFNGIPVEQAQMIGNKVVNKALKNRWI